MLVLGVRSQWSCPEGWTTKTASPNCAGVAEATCSDATCCKAHLCSEYSAVWAISQVAGGGCKVDNKFFDLKKGTTPVGGTQSEDDIKAACCTPFADATCADWPTSCGSGTSKVPTNSAPGDSNGALSQADFRTKCCVTTCSAYSVLWAGAQLLGGGCKADNKFFDLKKNAVTVGGTQSDSDIKAACCTRFADATCADWPTSCGSGTSKVLTNSAPGDSNGALSQANFRTKCCVAPVTTCSAYSVVWAAAQLLGGGCKPDNKFFDLKKSDVAVGGTQSDSDVKAACCTPFADATCADWNTVRTCDTGKFLDGAVAAPTDGTTISDSEYKELCCKDPMACADYVVETDAALSRTFPFAATFASVVGIFVL